MDPTVPVSLDARPLLPTEKRRDRRPRMAKARLRKTEEDDWRTKVGEAVARVQKRSELSLKVFAATIKRDERQVARWFTGAEHAQLAAIFAVPAFRSLLVVALAELAADHIEITTAITIRRIA